VLLAKEKPGTSAADALREAVRKKHSCSQRSAAAYSGGYQVGGARIYADIMGLYPTYRDDME
jgi:hypothetical protein